MKTRHNECIHQAFTYFGGKMQYVCIIGSYKGMPYSLALVHLLHVHLHLFVSHSWGRGTEGVVM